MEKKKERALLVLHRFSSHLGFFNQTLITSYLPSTRKRVHKTKHMLEYNTIKKQNTNTNNKKRNWQLFLRKDFWLVPKSSLKTIKVRKKTIDIVFFVRFILDVFNFDPYSVFFRFIPSRRIIIRTRFWRKVKTDHQWYPLFLRMYKSGQTMSVIPGGW